ncbi:tail fiber [Methylophilales phage Venkman EXVC282S]|nr:tail fiber [Methylophilales phage Venkman EXVC282S]
MSVAINGTNGVTYNDGSLQASAPVGKNKIINGDMRIDQRNAGASATTTSSTYMVDRFQLYASTVTNAQTYQQVTDAPAGFSHSLKITNSSTAQAAGSAALYTPRQRIEGYNTAHLNWGTSDAKTVTVSFWVKASVTGTYPFAINNGSFNRSFVANYTISSANTWEYKTVIVAGDTLGTWNVDNSSGMVVMFSLDTNSSYETSTVDAWHTGSFRATSSNVHFLANASATWQITGVQLEANTTATPFEYLQYGQQYALCQRYYQTLMDCNQSYVNTGQHVGGRCQFNTEMRANPTITSAVLESGNVNNSYVYHKQSSNSFGYYHSASAAGNFYWYAVFTMSSEL